MLVLVSSMFVEGRGGRPTRPMRLYTHGIRRSAHRRQAGLLPSHFSLDLVQRLHEALSLCILDWPRGEVIVSSFREDYFISTAAVFLPGFKARGWLYTASWSVDVGGEPKA